MRLFPMPKASDGPHGGPNQRSSKGVYDALPGAVVNLLPVPLFKTPTANLGRNGSSQHPDKRKAGGHGPTLDDEVSHLLPEAGPGEVQDWVDFEPAIRRQETVSGREAPIPTELGPKGGRRLAVRFAEWLMWLPDGHVTGVAGLNRSEQLERIGNGVVPQQAYEAYRLLLAHLNKESNA